MPLTSDDSSSELSGDDTYEHLEPVETPYEPGVSEARGLLDLMCLRDKDALDHVKRKGTPEQQKRMEMIELRKQHHTLLEYVLDNMDSMTGKMIRGYRRILRRQEVALGMRRKKQPVVENAVSEPR